MLSENTRVNFQTFLYQIVICETTPNCYAKHNTGQKNKNTDWKRCSTSAALFSSCVYQVLKGTGKKRAKKHFVKRKFVVHSSNYVYSLQYSSMCLLCFVGFFLHY